MSDAPSAPPLPPSGAQPPAAGSSQPPAPDSKPPARKGKGCATWGCLTMLVLLVVLGVVLWIINRPFSATKLSEEERKVRDAKIEFLKERAGGELDFLPEASTEADALATADQPLPAIDTKRLVFTEREINSLIGEDTDLAETMKVDLQRDQIVARFRYEVPKDSFLLAGKTLKFAIAVRVKFKGDDMDIVVTKVTFAGFPVPSAWREMFGMADGTDLFEALWTDERSRTLFLQGIEAFEITSDEIVFVPAD